MRSNEINGKKQIENCQPAKKQKKRTNIMIPGKHRANRRAGFTLVELMVVIAILGVLSVIAIPEYHRYRVRFFNTTAMADMSQFRNSVMNMETPTMFFVWQTTPGSHPNLPDMTVSSNVNIFSMAWDTGLGWVFMAWGCHTSGDTGYFLYIPITGEDPWGGWMTPNQIDENPGYRWAC